ncbi:MAG TPA: hypothetical protein VNP04_00570 [Alphaproteobacteria bacterium]|nr:hypothetical protein [Alphaproteobacteria bacterium]
MEAEGFLTEFVNSLDQLRWEGLHADLPSWWQEDPDTTLSPWQEAILGCYQHLTLYVFSLSKTKANVRNYTYGFLMPLESDGRPPANLSLWIHSGRDEVMPGEDLPAGWQGGNCAERKWLEAIPTRRVGMMPRGKNARGQEIFGPAPGLSIQQEVQTVFPTLGRHDTWLFYTTFSPCEHCSKAMVDHLRAGHVRHLVVAFEHCYVRLNQDRSAVDPVSRPHADFFRAMDQGQIEAFKVHRAKEDRQKLAETYRQRLESTGHPWPTHPVDAQVPPVALKNPHIDPTLRVMRVKRASLDQA